MNSSDILLIVLGVMLAIFLALGIAFLIYLLKLISTLKRLSDRLEHIAHNAESVSTFFKNSAGPLAATKIIAGLIESFRGRKQDKEGRNGKK